MSDERTCGECPLWNSAVVSVGKKPTDLGMCEQWRMPNIERQEPECLPRRRWREAEAELEEAREDLAAERRKDGNEWPKRSVLWLIVDEKDKTLSRVVEVLEAIREIAARPSVVDLAKEAISIAKGEQEE